MRERSGSRILFAGSTLHFLWHSSFDSDSSIVYYAIRFHQTGDGTCSALSWLNGRCCSSRHMIDGSSTTFRVGRVASSTGRWGPYAQRFSAVQLCCWCSFHARTVAIDCLQKVNSICINTRTPSKLSMLMCRQTRSKS